MTTIYSTTMAVASFTPPLVAVPVADAAGWRFSLGMWAVFAAVAIIPWIAMLVRERAARRRMDIESAEPARVRAACGACRSRGRSRSDSSRVGHDRVHVLRVAAASCSSTPRVSPLPRPARCSRCSRRWGCRHPCSSRSWWPATTRPGRCSASRSRRASRASPDCSSPRQAAPWLWVVLLGLEPLLFPLTLVLLGLRTRTHEGSVALSGFVQSIGYAIVALFPVGIGLLHGATDSWTGPLLVLAGVVAAAIPAGVVVAKRTRSKTSGSAARRLVGGSAVAARSRLPAKSRYIVLASDMHQEPCRVTPTRPPCGVASTSPMTSSARCAPRSPRRERTDHPVRRMLRACAAVGVALPAPRARLSRRASASSAAR